MTYQEISEMSLDQLKQLADDEKQEAMSICAAQCTENACEIYDDLAKMLGEIEY